jgi:hypothetical protein
VYGVAGDLGRDIAARARADTVGDEQEPQSGLHHAVIIVVPPLNPGWVAPAASRGYQEVVNSWVGSEKTGTYHGFFAEREL